MIRVAPDSVLDFAQFTVRDGAMIAARRSLTKSHVAVFASVCELRAGGVFPLRESHGN